ETVRGERIASPHETQVQVSHRTNVHEPCARRRTGGFLSSPAYNGGVNYRVGIINVTGFAGMEAARLLWNHPSASLVAATGRSLAGKKLGEAFPHLAVYRDVVIAEDIEEEVDVV